MRQQGWAAWAMGRSLLGALTVSLLVCSAMAEEAWRAETAKAVGRTLALMPPRDMDESAREVERELKATFRPEFLNRVDEIIVFNDLTVEDVERIVDLQMKEVAERLATAL